MRLSDAVLALSLVGSPLVGQSAAAPADTAEFVVSVRAATVRYREQAAAIADGYRRIGPDFPTMGEHWLSLALVVRDEVDPLCPPILEYVTVAGRPVLAGVAYAQLVREGLVPISLPAPRSAWHFHRSLRDRGLVALSDARVMRNQDGRTLGAGPCGLTPAGQQALEQDRRLGART